MKVRIVQLLCPQRHCVMALPYQTDNGAEIPEKTDELKKTFAELVQRFLNPWCGLCQSRNLHTEDQPTIFRTMDEARSFLEQSERDQTATAGFFRNSKN